MAQNLVNLGPLAWHVDARFHFQHGRRGTSLAKTVIHFLDRVLPKGPVRTSNWERTPLTEVQRECAYAHFPSWPLLAVCLNTFHTDAAGDAHSAFEIYQILVAQAASNQIDIDNCGHVVDMSTVEVYEFPDQYPLRDILPPLGLSSNEFHAYSMWYYGYNAADIHQTMA